MDISYFKEFTVLADTKNFWEASERLFIGESSLSKHIRTLERQLGAPLFERTSRKVSLTEFGKMMLPYAQSIAKLQYEYESAIFNFTRTKESLTIATIPVIAHYNLTDIILRFKRNHPSIRVDIEEADTLLIRDMLIDRKCQIAIFRDSADYLEHSPDKEAQIVKTPYCEDRLMAILHPSHPLAAEKGISLDQLADEQFVLLHEDTMPYELCMSACREAGFIPNVVFSSHNLEALLDMVRKGNCIALLFSGHVKFPHNMPPEPPLPFAAVPIVPEIRTTVCLGYLRNTKLSIAAAHFFDYCMQEKLMN